MMDINTPWAVASPWFHSFETSPELLPPEPCHNPSDRGGHMQPGNSRSADRHTDIHR